MLLPVDYVAPGEGIVLNHIVWTEVSATGHALPAAIQIFVRYNPRP